LPSGGTHVYVSNFGSNTVSVINTVTSVGVGLEPIEASVSPNGTQLYVANNGAAALLERVAAGVATGSRMVQVLGRPALLILPKLLNIVTDCTVLDLLPMRWAAARERGKSAQCVSDLETLAATDRLTRLYNRHHFQALARAELARGQLHAPGERTDDDIDHFKAVNDYCH
jgi:YVTN family beta-propeller protein